MKRTIFTKHTFKKYENMLMKYTFWLPMVILVGCASFPNKPADPANTPMVIKTPSGKASITVSDDGVIEIRGTHVLIYSEGRLILEGSPLDLNPSEQKKPETSQKTASQNVSHLDNVVSELHALPVIGADKASSQDSRITYSSTASFTEAIEFYQHELNKRGWTTTEIDIRQYDAEMCFQKGAEFVFILVIWEEGNTSFINILPLGSMNVKSLPHYPGSEIIYETAGYRGEETPDTVETVTEYLRTILQKAGWQEKEYTHVHEKDSWTKMAYIYNNTELSVYILAESQKSLIQFTLRRITGGGE